MPELRMKLCGLTEADSRSLKSMLRVVNDQLATQWKIVESGSADLYVYTFDTEEGILAWQQHNSDSLSALLTSKDQVDEPVDIVIKKPLRTKNFSTVLNNIECNTLTRHTQKSRQTAASPSLLTSLFTKWFGRKSKSSKPVLNLTLPEPDAEHETSILTLSELEDFLRTLQKKATLPQTENIAAYLYSLNRTELTPDKRFELAEKLFKPIQQLVISHYPDKYKFRQESHTSFVKLVHSMNQILTEFSLTYQRIVHELAQQGKKLKSHTQLGLAITRVAAISELSATFNQNYYFSLPRNTLHVLHQLYHYCEHAGVLDHAFSGEDAHHDLFLNYYKRILLMGIADPFHLPEHQLLQLPVLIAELAPHIRISQLENLSFSATSGSFILDLESDALPRALSHLENKTENTFSEHLRLFDTHLLLEKIEHFFRLKPQDPQLVLLKRLAPQFNASYSRQFKRQICHDRPKISLVLGFPAIHLTLTGQTLAESYLCTVHNKSAGGMMIESHVLNSYSIAIGDLVALTNEKQTAQLAVIRWISSSQHDLTCFGLEILPHTTPVTLTLGQESDSFPGLIVPMADKGSTTRTMLVDKDTYLPLQAMTVLDGQQSYQIVIDKLIESPINCQQFTYHIKD